MRTPTADKIARDFVSRRLLWVGAVVPLPWARRLARAYRAQERRIAELEVALLKAGK